MSDTLRSGNAELDAVLGGGLPGNAISLIMGLPGTGKTIVAQQYAFHAGHPDRPAVYFSTLSEPLEKIVRFGQTLDFFEPSAIGTSVFYEDLGKTVSADGLAGVVEQVTATLKQRRPGLIVIDSFKALRTFAGRRRRIQAVPAPARRAADRISRRLPVDRRIRRGGDRAAAGVRRR